MKKFLFIPFLLVFHFIYAGTGKANDEFLFILSIIGIMSLILSILYSIAFIGRIVKECKEKKIARLAENAASDGNNC